MLRPLVAAFALLGAAVTANAQPTELAPQLQIDGGLSVIGVGYEHPLARNIAIQGETFVFGTYFLPWFDLGDDITGIGVGIRATWFARVSGRGLYVTPYVRGAGVFGDSTGYGLEIGGFVGWAFGLGERLDLRVGGGLQYIRGDANVDRTDPFATPFVAIDAVLGYRL